MFAYNDIIVTAHTQSQIEVYYEGACQNAFDQDLHTDHGLHTLCKVGFTVRGK
jgi:hypothetical protein